MSATDKLVQQMLEDLACATKNIDSLVDGITDIAVQMGIVVKGAFVTGPMALMLIDDIKNMLTVHGFKENQ
ncbi:hypothetical protein PMW_190 [Pseudomonas phage phiPMW]|uniref:Uncharacterized protein n=1 Tax=Pseudomonas phage phiPMW TaxID=1815582 RepID=A0A1S5R1N5_9CAUD|nr:hypothetical protein FDG97_gp160 [Pseudomonas phage phiPMW]ANA49315.1 hypothetical protein PMW_190 [Pseudomonas phage phiPMW]